MCYMAYVLFQLACDSNIKPPYFLASSFSSIFSSCTLLPFANRTGFTWDFRKSKFVCFFPPLFLFSLFSFFFLQGEPLSFLFTTVIIVDATIKAGEAFGSRETQLSDGVLAFFLFTNADGLPLYFPPSSNPTSSSLPSYLNNFPYIFYSDLMPREEKCNGTNFLQHHRLISGLISSFSTPENTLDSATLSVLLFWFILFFDSSNKKRKRKKRGEGRGAEISCFFILILYFYL